MAWIVIAVIGLLLIAAAMLQLLVWAVARAERNIDNAAKDISRWNDAT